MISISLKRSAEYNEICDLLLGRLIDYRPVWTYLMFQRTKLQDISDFVCIMTAKTGNYTKLLGMLVDIQNHFKKVGRMKAFYEIVSYCMAVNDRRPSCLGMLRELIPKSYKEDWMDDSWESSVPDLTLIGRAPYRGEKLRSNVGNTQWIKALMEDHVSVAGEQA